MARVTTVNGAPHWAGSILSITILCAVFFIFTAGLRRHHSLHTRFRCKEMSTSHHGTYKPTVCQVISKTQIGSFEALNSRFEPEELDPTWIRNITNSVCTAGCLFTCPHFTRLRQNVWLVVEVKDDITHVHFWGRLQGNNQHIWQKNMWQMSCDEDDQDTGRGMKYTIPFTSSERIEKLSVTEATTQNDLSDWLCLTHFVIWLYLVSRHFMS